MTRQQYNKHFYEVPGAWWGSFLERGIGQITVDTVKAGEAIAHVVSSGFKVVDAYPSQRNPEGITLRIR